MYRNVVYEARNQQIRLYTWDEDGKRIEITQSYKPYLYVDAHSDKYTTATSIYNTPLRKIEFRNQSERFAFIKGGGNKRLFENFPAKQQYLLDTFWQVNETPDFTKNEIKMLLLDIETYSPSAGGFPNTADPTHPINVITVYDNLEKKFYTWGTKKYTGEFKENVEYVYCVTEKDLFNKFLNYLEKDYPDILSGWNSEFFDIPYIINRIKRVLGDEEALRLSPVGQVYSRDIPGKFGKHVTKWYVEGVSLLDYMDIYRKFAPERQSYKLNSIGEVENVGNKVAVVDMDLATLADVDWNTFIDYNIQDVNILVKLEEKLQYLGLVKMLAYVGCTTFEAAMGALSVINGAFCVRARHRKQIIPTFVRGEDTGKNPGAYVGEPQQGFQKYVVSFDANSLYPNVMISLNLSPETKIGKITNRTDDSVSILMVNGKVKEYTIPIFNKLIKDYDIAISKADILFHQKQKGIIPEIVDYYYNKRKLSKDEYVELKKQLADVDKRIKNIKTVQTPEIMEKLNNHRANLADKVTRAGTKQLTIKILINSIYGYFGNKHAPIGDDDIASSVTLSGQAVIKQSNVYIREYIKMKTGLTDKELKANDPIIYNDTDSSYASIELLIKHLKIPFYNDKGEVHDEVYKLEQELVEYLNTEIKKWGVEEFNSKDCRFVFKRECIGDVGIFLQKKRYVLNILDDEGAKINKTKYVGVEVVRTSLTPELKVGMKNVIETMLHTQNYGDTNKAMGKVYEVFKGLEINKFASVMGLNGYDKYANQCKGMKTAKRMPIHCKAAYFYNTLIKEHKLHKYESLGSGDKVRFFYAKKPNRYGIDCIGFKYEWPKEFNEFFKPDYDKIFEKIVYKPFDRYYKAVNWKCYLPNQSVKCDLFDMLKDDEDEIIVEI